MFLLNCILFFLNLFYDVEIDCSKAFPTKTVAITVLEFEIIKL